MTIRQRHDALITRATRLYDDINKRRDTAWVACGQNYNDATYQHLTDLHFRSTCALRRLNVKRLSNASLDEITAVLERVENAANPRNNVKKHTPRERIAVALVGGSRNLIVTINVTRPDGTGVSFTLTPTAAVDLADQLNKVLDDPTD